MKFRGREAIQIENALLRVTVLLEGGHIAEVLHKQSGINPLWQPPWPSIEPSAYQSIHDAQFGSDPENRLLAGIMGHNLCLDLFGPPSDEEAAAGLTVHGESSLVRYEFTASESGIRAAAHFPLSALRFERRILLDSDHPSALISETVENLLPMDRPLAWTQHVTLGPPFLENGVTRFAHNATRSQVFGPPSFGESELQAGAEFTWPLAPAREGHSVDLSTFSAKPRSASFTTHLMDPGSEETFVTAFHPKWNLSLTCRWQRSDFPWLGLWEENRSREAPPWNGQTVALGLEFGASPFPETRREMIDRGQLFGTPAFRWLGARQSVTVDYRLEYSSQLA